MDDKNKQFSANIIKNSTIVSAGGLVAKLIGLGSTLTVIHFLSLYEYGLYKLVFAAYGVLSSFLFSGIDQIFLADAAVEYGRNNLGKVKRYAVEYFSLKVFLGVALWAVAFFGAEIIGKFYSDNIVYLLKIVSFLFLVHPLRASINFLFKLDLKFLNVSFVSVIEETAKLSLILYLFWVAGWGVEAVVLAYVLSSLFGCLILFPFALRIIKPILNEKMSLGCVFWQTIKGHGKWGILTNYSMDLQKNIHPWLIKFFLGTEAVAIVSVAQSLIGHAVSLFPMVDVLTPTVPREIDDKERMKRIFFRGIKYSTFVFSCIAIGVFFFAPYFIRFLFPKYVPSLPVFNVLLLTLVFVGTANILTSFFYAFKMQRDLFIASAWRMFFMIIVAMVLFPSFGVIGVGIQVVLTFIFFVYLRYRSAVKEMPILAFSFVDLFRFDSYDRELLNRFKKYSFKIFRIDNNQING